MSSCNLSLGVNQSNQFNPSSTNDYGASATVGLSWNIFDSGVTNAQVKAAQTALDVAKLTLLKDQETVDYNLRQAYYNMREAEKRLNSTQDAVHQAEEDAFIAREKYRAGEGLMLDIIDAQEALSKARLNYISAQYDYARYKAAVENAMGMELTAEEKAAAAQLETNVDKVMAVPQTGTAPEASAASTRKVAEELAGNEVAK